MTVILARAKQAAKWAWAILALLVSGAAAAFVWIRWGPRKPELDSRPDPIDRALARYSRTTDEATYRAAVEIAAGQEKDHAVRAELLEVLALGDEDAAIDRLIAVGKRVRGER